MGQYCLSCLVQLRILLHFLYFLTFLCRIVLDIILFFYPVLSFLYFLLLSGVQLAGMDVGPDRDIGDPSAALSIPRYVATDISGLWHFLTLQYFFVCGDNFVFF